MKYKEYLPFIINEGSGSGSSGGSDVIKSFYSANYKVTPTSNTQLQFSVRNPDRDKGYYPILTSIYIRNTNGYIDSNNVVDNLFIPLVALNYEAEQQGISTPVIYSKGNTAICDYNSYSQQHKTNSFLGNNAIEISFSDFHDDYTNVTIDSLSSPRFDADSKYEVIIVYYLAKIEKRIPMR